MTSPQSRPVKLAWNEILVGLIFGLMCVQVWGPPGVAAQLLVTLALAARQPGRTLSQLVRHTPLLLVPMLACLSTLWSLAPDTSLRYGVQFLITAVIGVILAVSLAPSAFLRVVFLATVAVTLGSLLDGRQGPSAEGAVLIGLTGSKNQISYLGQLLVAGGVAVLVDHSQPRLARLTGLASLPLAAWILFQSHAATGVLTAIAGLLVFAAVMSLRLFRPAMRAIVIAGALATTVPAVIAAPAAVEMAQRFTTDTLKKDPTLTGRTYLWARADEFISDRPVLGHGYKAIWLGSSVQTIGLIRWARVDPRGFHFHDTYREIAVDLGIVGSAIFAITFALTGLALAWRAISAPSAATGFFLAMFAVLAARSKADIVIGTFNPYYALLLALSVYAFGWAWRATGEPRGSSLFAPPRHRVRRAGMAPS